MSRLTLALALAAALFSQSALAVTFKIATILPDGTKWMNEMRQGAATIKEKTGGRVEFRFYPGGIMGNDKSVLRKMRVGQLQGGAITGGSLADIYTDGQIYSLPFLFRSYAEVDYVRGKMDKLLLAGLRKNGYVSFGIGEGGFAYLMSNEPVTKTEDLQGKKVWVPEGDAINRAAFESFGISPVSLPLTDVLTGLQTGLIDTVANSTSGAIALQWHSRVKYMNTTPLLYLYGTMVVQSKYFDKLSAADQKVVMTVMSDVFKRLDVQNRQDNEAAREALKKQGIEFLDSNETEAQAWRAGAERTIEKMSKQGVVSPEIVAIINKHLSDFRKAHADTN